MTSGLIALVVALVCALAVGALWRVGNGRMRTITRSVRRNDAAAQPTEGSLPDQVPQSERSGYITREELGHDLGERATLVQFSSAFCAPCRATRRILADVAAMTEGVVHVEIDAESRLDLVRSLNVIKTPTVLVTDQAGQIIKRAAGQPRKADVIAALGEASLPGIPTNLIGTEASDSGSPRA